MFSFYKLSRPALALIILLPGCWSKNKDQGKLPVLGYREIVAKEGRKK